MAGEVRAGRLHAIKDDEEFPLAAQVEELPCDLTGLLVVVALRNVCRRVSVAWVVLEGDNVTALAGKGSAFVDVPHQAAVVFVALVPAELLVRVEDRNDIVDQRSSGEVVCIVVALATLRETREPRLQIRKWPSSSREWPANCGPQPKKAHVAFGSFQALRM